MEFHLIHIHVTSWVELTGRHRNNICFTNETHWLADGHSLPNTCPFYAFYSHNTIKLAYENMQECSVLTHQVISLQTIFLFLFLGHWELIHYPKILLRFTPCAVANHPICAQDSWLCKFYVTTYICRWRDSQYHIRAIENCSIQSFDHHTIIYVLDLYHWFLQMNSLWKIKAIWFGIADPSGPAV